MVGPRIQAAVVALSFMTVGATPAHAFFHHCCNRWFGAQPATTYYAPAVAYAPVAPAPAPCTTCNYMPQTCYRTVYVNTPVVAYQPVSSCNPCNGCPQTVMRPVTSFVMQPRLVAYTTYRPVCNTACAAPACPTPCAQPACSSCATPAVTTAAYTPAVAPAAPAPCCNTSYQAPLTSAPAISAPTSAAPMTGIAPSTSPTPTPTYPSEPPSSAPPSEAPKTFQDSAPGAEPQSRLMPPQSSSFRPAQPGTPRALDSEDQDRTTSLPQRAYVAARAVSTSAPATPAVSNDGWRAARGR